MEPKMQLRADISTVKKSRSAVAKMYARLQTLVSGKGCVVKCTSETPAWKM